MSEVSESTVVSDVGRQYLRLSLAGDVGPVRLRNLVSHFGSIEAALGASMAELQKVPQVGEVVARSIFQARNDGRVDEVIDQAAEGGVHILCAEDADYPRSLVNIPDPPICLFVRGRIEPTDVISVAIVGTRKCSHYGAEQARRFGSLLGQAGFTVVSGLARGIDSYAHRGALQGGGRTIAVLGNGLNTIYPPEHGPLAEDIVRSGAVISELAMDLTPEAKNFPQRNRVIAGLTLGVIVVEAGKRSGALITARHATEYNREVFAIPGRVDQPDKTLGIHRLIRDSKAKLITCLEDVLDEFQEVGDIMRPEPTDDPGEGAGESAGAPIPVANLAPHERTVFEAVTTGHEDIEDIREATALPVWRISSTLTALQLKGLVRQLPGNRFVPRSSSTER
jgi:DNA processing protein